MQSAWLSALAFLVVSTLLGLGVLGVARALRVRARRDYVVALFFVLFDVEAVFLFPWAVVLRELGAQAFIAAVSFVVVLMLGWLYALRKEALQWQ